MKKAENGKTGSTQEGNRRNMYNFRFRVPIAMTMKNANFWDVMPCNLAEVNRCLAT